MAYAVIRVRGGIKSAEGVEETLGYLNLTRVNHCTVIPQTPSYKGMLQKVKDYVTWGEISPATLEKLIALKGEMTGRKRITNEDLKSISDFPSIKALAEALAKDEASYNQLKSVRPLFRLSPPLMGYEGVKNQYNPSYPRKGGSLGYRGESINKLLEKMLPDALEQRNKVEKPAKKAPATIQVPAKEKKAVPVKKVAKAEAKSEGKTEGKPAPKKKVAPKKKGE